LYIGDAEDCTSWNANFVPTRSLGAAGGRPLQAVVNPSGTNELAGMFDLGGEVLMAAL
jgi:hypothetical protein